MLCADREQCLYFTADVFNLESLNSLKMDAKLGMDKVRQCSGSSHQLWPYQCLCYDTFLVCSFGKVMLWKFWIFQLVCNSTVAVVYCSHYMIFFFLTLKKIPTHWVSSCSFSSLAGRPLLSYGNSNRPLAKCFLGGKEAQETRLLKLWQSLVAAPWFQCCVVIFLGIVP